MSHFYIISLSEDVCWAEQIESRTSRDTRGRPHKNRTSSGHAPVTVCVRGVAEGDGRSRGGALARDDGADSVLSVGAHCIGGLDRHVSLPHLAVLDVARLRDCEAGGGGNDLRHGAREHVAEVDVAAQSANLPREIVVRAVVQRDSAVAEDDSHFLAIEASVIGVDAGGVEPVYLICAAVCDEPRVLL